MTGYTRLVVISLYRPLPIPAPRPESYKEVQQIQNDRGAAALAQFLPAARGSFSCQKRLSGRD